MTESKISTNCIIISKNDHIFKSILIISFQIKKWNYKSLRI